MCVNLVTNYKKSLTSVLANTLVNTHTHTYTHIYMHAHTRTHTHIQYLNQGFKKICAYREALAKMPVKESRCQESKREAMGKGFTNNSISQYRRRERERGIVCVHMCK